MTKTITILLLTIAIATLPMAFADSDREDKLEFAGTLEETLGHFWALELNLDENNAELALVHAGHPIAELYDTMAEHLRANPSFDAKLQQTLMDLQNKANTKVSRAAAQDAIDEAKDIINEAREIVVGHELSDDPDFKMQLINGLLETAKVEYHEAVANGIIKEMAEFQDGSAFVWRSQQIFESFDDEIDPIDSARINDYYAEVWINFDARADPHDVENWIDAVIYEFEEISGIQSITSKHEEEVFGMTMPPLKQLKEGISPKDIVCKPNYTLVFKPTGDPACVKASSAQKLISMGWSQ